MNVRSCGFGTSGYWTEHPRKQEKKPGRTSGLTFNFEIVEPIHLESRAML